MTDENATTATQDAVQDTIVGATTDVPTAAEVPQESVTAPAVVPVENPVHAHSYLDELEDFFKKLGRDISAEVAAIRAKL